MASGNIEFQVKQLLAELPDLPNPPTHRSQLAELAQTVGSYYKELRQAGVPLSVAGTLVAELHNFIVWKNDQ